MFDHVYSKDRRFVLLPCLLYQGLTNGELVNNEIKMAFLNGNNSFSLVCVWGGMVVVGSTQLCGHTNLILA